MSYTHITTSEDRPVIYLQLACRETGVLVTLRPDELCIYNNGWGPDPCHLPTERQKCWIC